MTKYDISKCCQFCDCGSEFCGDPCGGAIRTIRIEDEETDEVENVFICQIHHMDLIEFANQRKQAEREISKIPKHELN